MVVDEQAQYHCRDAHRDRPAAAFPSTPRGRLKSVRSPDGQLGESTRKRIRVAMGPRLVRSLSAWIPPRARSWALGLIVASFILSVLAANSGVQSYPLVVYVGHSDDGELRVWASPAKQREIAGDWELSGPMLIDCGAGSWLDRMVRFLGGTVIDPPHYLAPDRGASPSPASNACEAVPYVRMEMLRPEEWTRKYRDR